VSVPESLAGRTLGSLDLQNTYAVAVLMLHRGGTVTLNPAASEVLRATDELIVAGLDDDLERLPAEVKPM
jgi:uncharacterized protein with PhoU and TrkA domain